MKGKGRKKKKKRKKEEKKDEIPYLEDWQIKKKVPGFPRDSATEVAICSLAAFYIRTAPVN